MLIVVRNCLDRGIGDHRHQLRFARADRVCRAEGLGEMERVALLELPSELLLCAIGVNDGDQFDFVIADDVDCTPIGEPRNGQPGQRLRCRLVVQ